MDINIVIQMLRNRCVDGGIKRSIVHSFIELNGTDPSNGFGGYTGQD
jgi:hypothetical protein